LPPPFFSDSSGSRSSFHWCSLSLTGGCSHHHLTLLVGHALGYQHGFDGGQRRLASAAAARGGLLCGCACRRAHLTQHFLDFLRETDTPAPALSTKRFSQALHIDLQMLAEQAHVHRNTIARAPGSPGVQGFLREALRIIKAATDLNGDINKALFWYRNEPLSVFGYKTAERL